MLNELQKNHLQKIPKGAMADIQPWSPKAAEFAKNLIEKIRKELGLEVFWVGSLMLGIIGKNDIDLYIFCEPENFEKYLPRLIKFLDEPTYKLEDKILWRVIKDGHRIDASLISKHSQTVQKDIFFIKSLKDSPSLLEKYIELKDSNLTAREYYRTKNEFYNRVTGKQ